jgi:DNA polymerase III subunit gamma/tau
VPGYAARQDWAKVGFPRHLFFLPISEWVRYENFQAGVSFMPSLSLYRKWRSQTFGDLVGQEPVIRTLKNALSSGNLSHAYLFTGPRGTGKTSTARLLAKTVNCLHPHDGEPCNDCEQCREITVGSSFNVIEIDAASNRGIDSIRELREKVMVPPANGKYKVYILDEAHMLTTEAFNALLKTLEEPPAHAIFVMATTDVHKMLPTVLSRCQRFDFKRFSNRQLVDRLRFIADEEHVTLEAGAAELIARAAAGGMRDALSLLDQAIAYAGNTISLNQVQVMLGVADPRAIQKFVSHIANSDSPAGLHLIHELSESGADLRQINAQVAEYYRAMMLTKAGASIGEILDLTDDEMNEIMQAAQWFSLEELTECARIFAQNELVQKSQGTPQLGLELALLACIELHSKMQSHQSIAPTPPPPPPPPPATHPKLAPTQDHIHPSGMNGTNGTSAAYQARIPQQNHAMPPSDADTDTAIFNGATKESMPSKDQAQAMPHQGQTTPPPNPDIDADADAVLLSDAAKESMPSRDQAAAQQNHTMPPSDSDASADTVSNAPKLTIAEVKERWEYIKRRVRSRKDGIKTEAFLKGYAVVGVDNTQDVAAVVVQANAAFFYNALQQNASHRETIEWAMRIELGRECKLRLLPPGQSLLSLGSIPPPAPPDSGPTTIIDETLQHSSNHKQPTPASDTWQTPTKDQMQSAQSVHVADQPQEQRPATASSAATVEVLHSPPLAITPSMRENTTTTGDTRQEIAAKKAHSDQVVQAALRMFKAEIKNIRLK